MNKLPLPSTWLDKQVTVIVVGAGGTGSQILFGLAKLDRALRALGHPFGLDVTVVDDDLVSESNVGRQNFFPSDVGQAKSTLLVSRINAAMGTAWGAVVEKVSESGNIRTDLVIGCVDNRAARGAILDAFRNGGGGWWLDIGNRLSDGQAILGQVHGRWQKPNPDRIPHVADLFPDAIDPAMEDPDDGPSCSLAEALEKQSLFVNQSLATAALNMLWKWFRFGELPFHGVFVNLDTARTTPLANDPDTWRRFGYRPPKQRKPRSKKLKKAA